MVRGEGEGGKYLTLPAALVAIVVGVVASVAQRRLDGAVKCNHCGE